MENGLEVLLIVQQIMEIISSTGSQGSDAYAYKCRPTISERVLGSFQTSSWLIRIKSSMNPSLTALIMSEVVLPGEPVDAKHPNLKLGPGLLQLSDGSTISTKAGILCHNHNRSKWWVESNSRRVSAKDPILSSCVCSDLFQYIPAAQESVIGVVVGKNGAEGFRVDIGGPHNANLDALAFEGATKRNRPNLKVVSTS